MDENTEVNNENNVVNVSVWRPEQEDILKKWADKAMCYKAMHDKSIKKYWCLNARFNIPVIILSTLTGTGNFAQGSFDPKYAGLLVVIIGGANLFSAILGTISQYINVAGTLEGHKFASISWDKYARSIQVELGKVRSDRIKDPVAYIKKCQEEFDRLTEISPSFSTDVIEWFNKLINTGEVEDKQCCGVCCYECFCLPCGLRGCKKMKPCCGKKDEEKENKKNEFRSNWKEIELPEVLGKINPTKVIRDEFESGMNEHKYRINDDNIDFDV